MKNVTRILTTVVLCAAVFASTQRTDALGGNAAFWPDDEANIAAFPANINNHSFVQVGSETAGMGTATAGVDMVFGSGDNNWGLGFSNSSGTWFDLGWGNGSNMGINFAMTASDNGSGTTDDGFVLSYGNSDVFGMNFGFHYKSGETNTADWADNGMTFNLAKDGCDCWVFNRMVAEVWMPAETETDDANAVTTAATCTTGDDGSGGDWDGTEANCSDGFVAAFDTQVDDQDMTIDLDWVGNLGTGATNVMFAMGMEYDALDAGLRSTANLGVEVDVTSNVTLRGGMEWGYDLSNDGDTTGANGYAWSTGAGVNVGDFNADFTIGSGFWNNPLGWVSGEDDDAAWGACTVTYNF